MNKSKWTETAVKKPPSGTLVLCCSMEATSVPEAFFVAWRHASGWTKDNRMIAEPAYWTEIPPVIQLLQQHAKD